MTVPTDRFSGPPHDLTVQTGDSARPIPLDVQPADDTATPTPGSESNVTATPASARGPGCSAVTALLAVLSLVALPRRKTGS